MWLVDILCFLSCDENRYFAMVGRGWIFLALTDNFEFKVRVATMTHDHDDTPHAILTLLVVPAGKWVNL